MPVPTLVTDLSTTVASNSPAGSDNVFPDLDNYLRALSGFVASIRDNSGNGWVSPYLPLTYSAGTANGVVYLNGSKVVTTGSALVFDGSNLGIGTTSPGGVRLSVDSASAGLAANFNSTNASGVYLRFQNSGTTIGDLGSGANLFSGGTAGDFGLTSRSGNLVLGTSSAERARITSGGNLLVGKTAADFTVAGAEIKPAGNIELTRNAATNCIQINKKGNAGDLMAFYYNDSSVVGTITNSSTNTAYNTSSDRRLKENIAPADDAGAVIDAIEVVQHDWKVGGHTRFGVIAQDLNAVAPEAVSVGDDGDEIERTWGVDYSKLVPMLIKEIQTLRARVAALEAA